MQVWNGPNDRSHWQSQSGGQEGAEKGEVHQLGHLERRR